MPTDNGAGGAPAVETRGLTKRFGARAAIDGVDLCVPRGSAFGFLGPNGAGKTTMIRMLLGLTHPNAGSMSLLGHPVPAERAQALRRVGAIVEEPRFHPNLTGRENLRIVAAARGPEVRARIAPALRRVGLAERADEKVKKYSLGMRQRLGVARCLLADPLLLILDEPTNGLDPGGIQEFREMIRAMVEQENRTVFLSSHLLDEVEKICDHAAIVDRGKVIAQGPIAELAGGGDGARNELIVGVDDVERALGALRGSEWVREARRSNEGLRVVLSGASDSAAQVNATLVHAGVGVMRLEPVRHSLEQRFLEVTTRLEGAGSDGGVPERVEVSAP
ncbi:MAG TPA: ABC transporter ATP-binding protein [Solirubrobacteraceae bacterium]|jgi:ABC-2 type transport system ATP-binding protein|nr:ABC transporter ATP-binding protein [Solirubrobacteraceae bacterium]